MLIAQKVWNGSSFTQVKFCGKRQSKVRISSSASHDEVLDILRSEYQVDQNINGKPMIIIYGIQFTLILSVSYFWQLTTEISQLL